jgi:D-threo-aldose 1-dehydrogenase
MDPLELAEIGSTGLRVSRLGVGGVALGQSTTDEEAAATLSKCVELGVSYFDTAPVYGGGVSELRYGRILSGIPRSSFTISTKVGRLLEPAPPAPVGAVIGQDASRDMPYIYDYDTVMRVFEGSLKRLNLDHVDILLIHDPDNHFDQAMEGAYKALAELRSQRVISAIGAGMNQWEMEAQLAREGDFDCFLLAGRYTLLDHSALSEFLPLCQEKNISVIIGGPYNSGILASNLTETATFNYLPASAEVLEQARRCKAVCDRHSVPLKAVALQFVFGHPTVAAVIPGPGSVAEAEENFRMMSHPIPSSLWEELRHERLIPADAPCPQ